MMFCLVPLNFYVHVEHPPTLFTIPVAPTSRPFLSILSPPGPQRVTPYKVEFQFWLSFIYDADVNLVLC